MNALERFRKAEADFRDARIRESQLRKGLEKEAELLSLVEAEDEDRLRGLKAELEERATALEEMKREHTEIATRLREAGSDRRLEEALGAVAETREELEDAREEALTAALGHFLVEEVRDEHRSENEPAVLRNARERFQRFTHHEWSLELDEEDGIRALDLRLGESRRLEELSSGTRMQLLLAVRVAWTRTLEEGREALPLFLDEALTTSDPDRFGRIAESLEALAAEEGRQVLYLCAQPSDVVLWERATGRRPHVVDLAELRFGPDGSRTRHDFALPERRPLPAPEGKSPEEYGARLGVPAISPWRDPASIHLFHLVRDDLSLLHHLMEEWRVRSLGQLEALLRSAVAEHAVEDAEARASLAARCALARLWVRAWRIGRGRPVDRGALEESGAVSEAFIDQVADLSGELAGDADALLEALPEVPRFRRAKIEELATWLEEKGFLAPEDPMTAEEREARVLKEGAGLTPPSEAREALRWLEVGVGSSPPASGGDGDAAAAD